MNIIIYGDPKIGKIDFKKEDKKEIGDEIKSIIKDSMEWLSKMLESRNQ